MKTAAKVFIIIGLVCSVIILISGFIVLGAGSEEPKAQAIGLFYLLYGIYSLATSIGSLVAIHKTSKTAIIIWGVFYIPVMLIGSIFMFCIKEEDLW